MLILPSIYKTRQIVYFAQQQYKYTQLNFNNIVFAMLASIRFKVDTVLQGVSDIALSKWGLLGKFIKIQALYESEISFLYLAYFDLPDVGIPIVLFFLISLLFVDCT